MKVSAQMGAELRRAPRADVFSLVGLAGKTTTYHCDTLTICTGLHVLPAVPAIPGLPENLVPQSPPVLAPSSAELPMHPPVENWAKEKQAEGVRVIHSSQYKKRSEFEGRRVLILGVSSLGFTKGGGGC